MRCSSKDRPHPRRCRGRFSEAANVAVASSAVTELEASARLATGCANSSQIAAAIVAE